MNHVGREQTIRLDGRAYRLSRFTRGLFRLWIEWAKTVVPDPRDGLDAYLFRFPAHVQFRILEEVNAILDGRDDLTDPDLAALWQSEEGVGKAFCLLLEKFHWQEQAEPILEKAKAVYNLQELIVTASGRIGTPQSEIQEAFYVSHGLLSPSLPPSRRRKTDWAEIDRELFKNAYITPAQVDELTLPELQAILVSDAQTDSGREFAKARAYAKLTPEQRAELERMLLAANT